MKLIRLPFKLVAWLFRRMWKLALALLIVSALFSIDWSAPDWEPSQPETARSRRALMQNCALAHREFGERIYELRPDCRRFLPPQPANR